MGKAKRFNSYDETVKAQREKVKGFGQERQNLAGIASSFRSPPLVPPITTKIRGTGTGDGKFLTASLAADQTTNIAATDHVEFDTKDEDGGIVLQTGSGQADGIFELLGGRKYILSGQLRPEFSGATGQLVIAWYDITNSAELGSRAIYEAQTHASDNANQPLAEILVTPTANITVELRIISVTALTALANEYCTASLFEIALGGFGAGGGGGGGGGTITFPITPTIKDESDTWTSPVTIDLSLTTAHMTKFTLDTNLTLVFSNPPSSGTQIEFEIEFIQDATGGRTVTFPASVVESVSIASAALATTIVTCRTNDGGTTYHVIPALRGSVTLSGADFAKKDLSNLVNVAINTSLISDTDDADDLGSASKEWKDLFIDGTAEIDVLNVSGVSTHADDITITKAAGFVNFTGTAGGGNEGITYKDSGGTQRYGLLIEATNKVVLANRAANGTIDIRANTASAGAGGEVTVATFQDTVIDFLQNIELNGKTITESGNILPNANNNEDLGSALKSWANCWCSAVRFDDDLSAPTGSSPHRISTSTNGMDFNTEAQTDSYTFYHKGVAGLTVKNSVADQTTVDVDVLECNDHVLFQVNGTTPLIDGVMSQDGSGNVKVFSGGALKNFTQVYQKDASNLPTVNNSFDVGGQSFKFTNVYTDVIRFPETTGDTTTRIGQSGGHLEYRVKTGDLHNFEVNDESMLDIGRTGTNAVRVRFRPDAVTTQFVDVGSTGFVWEVPAGDAHVWKVDGNEHLQITDDLINFSRALRLVNFSDGSRPTAAAAGAGGVIWSTTDNVPIYSDGGNWRLFSDNSVT